MGIKPTPKRIGIKAQSLGYEANLCICNDLYGYYIGTRIDGINFTKESVEYYDTIEQAYDVLNNGTFIQSSYYNPEGLKELQNGKTDLFSFKPGKTKDLY